MMLRSGVSFSKFSPVLFANSASEESLRESAYVLKNSVRDLSEYLSRYYDKPVILLVDEYDVPLQNAYVEGYYEKAVKFFKTFYGTTFKDNPYLEKTVITGVSRVAKESIFSRGK